MKWCLYTMASQTVVSDDNYNNRTRTNLTDVEWFPGYIINRKKSNIRSRVCYLLWKKDREVRKYAYIIVICTIRNKGGRNQTKEIGSRGGRRYNFCTFYEVLTLGTMLIYCTNKSKQGWGNKSVDYLNGTVFHRNCTPTMKKQKQVLFDCMPLGYRQILKAREQPYFSPA